ncbi:MAG: PKD domain-containing protein, partial [Thermoplasmata archaeon]|nr:PKD domain-containing protein [Thermoplasmata archaeon]
SGNTYGIYIPSGESIGGWRYRYNIRIFNNYLQNHINALAYETISWNISKTQGTNIVGGHYLGGNYWSDYTGVDIDGDGIGDTNLPYNCSGNIVNGGDYAPLVARSTPWVYHTDAPIRAIAISRPNGKYVAVGSYKSSVYLFTREGKKIWKKPVPITSNGWGRSTGSVDISSDDPNVIAEGGPFVVAGGFDNKIYLFDRDGREVWSYDTGHDVYCVAISYFGDKIVCGAGNKIYYFLRNNAFPQWSYNVGARIHHIAMSWDGNYIAVGDCHGGTHLFKATGEKIWSYYSSPSDIARVDISLRGESLVAGTDDMSDSHGCKLFYFSSLKDGNPEWSATDGNPIWSFIKSENPGYDFWAVAISENGGWIAAGGSALNATYLFNKNSSTPKQIYSIGTAHAMDTAYAIDFSCNGDYLAVGTQRGRLLCFENNRNDPLLEYAAGKTIGVVSMSSNGHYVAAGSDNGNIYFFLLPIPVADFSFTPFNPTAADTIQFNDLSYDLDGTIVNWTWDFGDGSISYEQNPQHRYADDRIYTVTLTVTDNDGATASITKQIIVLPAVDTNPPVTQKEIGNPKHDAYITAFTPIYLNASDNETGVNYTYYEIWWDSDGDGIIDIQVKNVTVYDDDTNDLDSSVGNISIKFCFSEECLHELKWYSVDNAGNVEEAHTQIHYVDSSAPETIIEFGVPYYEAAEGNIWIASSTPVHFLAVDYPACASGIRATYYRVWYGVSWSRWTLYDENLSLEGEGKHYVEFHSVDNVGNIEEVHNQTFYVDNSAPRTIIEFHGPYYSDGIEEWISPDTLISLNATDYLVQKPTISDEKETGCGVNKTFYRVYKEGEKPPEKFSVYTGPFSVDEECTHIIEFYSVDNLGNTERVRTKVVKVDNSPPETNLTIGNPHVYKGNSPFVTSHTPFKFSSNDTGECAVGVENIWYRVWSIQTGWSDWMI